MKVDKGTALSAAKYAASGMASAAAAGTGAIIGGVQSKQAMPPPRTEWTYGLLSSCCNDLSFGCRACFCPCLAVVRINSYLNKGHENAPSNWVSVYCSYLCASDNIAGTRDRVREKTNMDTGECCSKVCCDTLCTTVFCWGCALAQDRRELQVYFGHAGSGAPVHPGTPAALSMNR
jgi:Cys-rich protein (TIGR01571 family)